MSLRDQGVRSDHSELLAVATAMLEGRVHLIEGTREICRLRLRVEEPETDVFMPLRAIESETDHLPIGEVRARCAPEYLRQMDDEMNLYITATRKDILSARRELLRAFS